MLSLIVALAVIRPLWVGFPNNRMKHKIAIALFLALLILIIIAAVKTAQLIKQARTFDTIGMVAVAMSKSLAIESWNKGYDVVRETRSMFPEVKTSEGAMLDAWNNPIHIEIQRLAKTFLVRIVSAGIDQKFGTADDCVREFQIKDEPAPKSDGKP